MNDRLQRMRAELNKKRDALLQNLSDDRVELEVSSHGDLVDQSSNYAEREMMLGMTEHDISAVRNIDAALKSIDAGTYGICDDCKEEIPEARLVALPTTTLCVGCQEKRERSGTR